MMCDEVRERLELLRDGTLPRDEAMSAVEAVMDRILADGVSQADLGSRTVEVTVGGRRAVVDLKVTGGPGLYEVRAVVRQAGDAGRDVEVAALCEAGRPSAK